MDLSSLAVILQAALSPNPDERKAAEQGLNQVRLSFRLLSNSGSDQSFDRFSLCVYLIRFCLSVCQVRMVVKRGDFGVVVNFGV